MILPYNKKKSDHILYENVLKINEPEIHFYKSR